MKALALVSALAAVILCITPAANAAPTHLTATLLPTNEVPPTASTGSGTANVDVDPVAHTLHVNITFAGLVPLPAGAPSGTTASHIHCCLPTAFATGVNAGVATTTPTFPDFPLNVLSGTYDRTFSLLDASTYNPAFVTLQGSLGAAETALVNGILGGLTYLNVHTVAFPGGEIRGFLVAVPEPESYAMLLAGLAILGFVARRKRVTRRT